MYNIPAAHYVSCTLYQLYTVIPAVLSHDSRYKAPDVRATEDCSSTVV